MGLIQGENFEAEFILVSFATNNALLSPLPGGVSSLTRGLLPALGGYVRPDGCRDGGAGRPAKAQDGITCCKNLRHEPGTAAPKRVPGDFDGFVPDRSVEPGDDFRNFRDAIHGRTAMPLHAGTSGT